MATTEDSIAAQQKLGQADADPGVAAQQKMAPAQPAALDFLTPSDQFKKAAGGGAIGAINKALGGN